MARMGRLQPGDMLAKHRFMKPQRYFPAQSAFAFRRMKKSCAMQGMAREWRCSLAGNDQNELQACAALAFKKVVELHASHLEAVTMQVDAGVRLKLTPGQALRCTTVKGKERWWCMRRAHFLMPPRLQFCPRRFRHARQSCF